MPETATSQDVALQPQSDSDDLSDAVSLKTLIRDGLTVEQAAKQLKMSRSTAFRRLSMIQEDVDRGIVNLLIAKGFDFADNWIRASEKAAEKGDHRPAKDALLHIRAIEPVNDGSQGTNIAIVIGTPDQPIRLQPPQVVVDVSSE